uniref:B box-type domain-containing protein n=1 Tax=Panagrolaimus sp. JU765 TaxID=591449 RepID=A0AC34QF20_9BILA
MMSNGGSSHHYNNVPQQHPQPIPLSQIQPLMGTTSFPQPNPRRIYHQPPPQQQQHPISIQRMMLETTYPINNSGNGFSASSTSSSGSSAPPLIRGYFGGRKLYENVDKQPCITCNEMVPSDQLSQLACGHRQCIQCLSMMGQLDKCPNCYSMGIFGGTHIREAFNSETSSPILGISTGNSHGIVMRNGSNSTLSTPLSIQNLKFNDYNIWEPLPLNQQNSTSNEKSDQTNLSKLFDNLSMKPQQQQLCTNCDEKSIITSFCVDCNEFLCAICVMAHARVKLTKDHQIQQLIEQKNDLLSQKCSEHDNLTYFIKCLTCNGTNLCIKCLQFHPKHSLKFLQTKTTNDMKILLKNLINDTKIIQLLLKNNYENVNKMEEKLQLSIEKVIMEMTNVINLYMKIIDEKKDELLKKIDTIQTTKICLLKNQNEKIYEKITTFEKLLNYSDEIIKSGNDKEIFDYYEQILKLHCENLSTTFFPITNDEIFFKLSVEKNFLNELKNFGNIDSGIDPSSTQIIGNRFKRAISGRPFVVNIQMKDVLGEIVTKESRQKFCFGKEGSGDGEFSRPWGICCDLKGRIIVADRSNHRIQIFDSRGKFLMKFGQKGMRPGDFNRPAGVCVNPSVSFFI